MVELRELARMGCICMPNIQLDLREREKNYDFEENLLDSNCAS